MINEDSTLNPERTSRGVQQMQHEEIAMERSGDLQMEQQYQMRSAQGVKCPHCGAMNEPEAAFCAASTRYFALKPERSGAKSSTVRALIV